MVDYSSLGIPAEQKCDPNCRKCSGNKQQLNERKIGILEEIISVERHLKLEKMLMEETNTEAMPRCSTPSHVICEHCDHDHKQECCLYYLDKPEDAVRYSKWKIELETNKDVPAQYVPKIPEAISGATTPSWFPTYSLNNPHQTQTKVFYPIYHQQQLEEQYRREARLGPFPQAQVYVKQFSYPAFAIGQNQMMENPYNQNRMNPYQQLLAQHQIKQHQAFYQQQQHYGPQNILQFAAREAGIQLKNYNQNLMQFAAQQPWPQNYLQYGSQENGMQMNYQQQYHQCNYYNQQHHQQANLQYNFLYPQQIHPTTYTSSPYGSVPIFQHQPTPTQVYIG